LLALFFPSLIIIIFRIKAGKLVIITAGRFAGKKAIIIKASEEGNDSKKFGHALGTDYIVQYIDFLFSSLFLIRTLKLLVKYIKAILTQSILY